MKRVLPFLLALLLLGGCTTAAYQERQAEYGNPQERSMAVMEDELRARLNEIRDNPSQASPALIRDLQTVLKTLRDRQAMAASIASTAPVVVPKKSPPVRLAKPAESTSKTAAAAPLPAAVQDAPRLVAPLVQSGNPPGVIYATAMVAEQEDKPLQAVALYRHASSLGHAMATKRLMEIYAEGMPGVARNYVAAVKFKNLALRQGAPIDEKYAQ